ncbi:hypothetical protein K488DRAFT_73662 [Vararia minispora EC-137]|uniref:Uncharacterized protein n=1 Tax=Vararia minispora EC-137 TaxID=1314806 RepID=A0ACB8Q9U1_9AGAM|nr:hypothetical protein K488DRAFT_73662 [Vararia minispora EC-137]
MWARSLSLGQANAARQALREARERLELLNSTLNRLDPKDIQEIEECIASQPHLQSIDRLRRKCTAEMRDLDRLEEKYLKTKRNWRTRWPFDAALRAELEEKLLDAENVALDVYATTNSLAGSKQLTPEQQQINQRVIETANRFYGQTLVDLDHPALPGDTSVHPSILNKYCVQYAEYGIETMDRSALRRYTALSSIPKLHMVTYLWQSSDFYNFHHCIIQLANAGKQYETAVYSAREFSFALSADSSANDRYMGVQRSCVLESVD